MNTRRKSKRSKPARRARSTHGRQRQLLIDACISALHIYGPSRTTVEKVVAIADMSPGIVRFYFASKAAMLVASLQYLAAEFEERVLNPVADLRTTPVAALERLVDLYLDPQVSSSRKVSVWYSFWGEASSRQEYYDICGQKDERFAALVLELVERLIVETNQPQLDADGVALGLIGVLEMLWQDFAFRNEAAIDRDAAKRRCMAYLRSVFPGRFAVRRSDDGADAADPLPAWSYDSEPLAATERAALFRGTWQLAGHESQIAAAGDYLALDLYAERVLVLRDSAGALRAFRNNCPAEPHDLVPAGAGACGAAGVECRMHGLRFALDGVAADPRGGPSLHPLELCTASGLVWVRTGAERDGAATGNPGLSEIAEALLSPVGAGAQFTIAADWKLAVEQCLELSMAEPAGAGEPDAPAGTPADQAGARIAWVGEPTAGHAWTAGRYRALVGEGATESWRRILLPPNQLVELRPDGITILQILPAGPGRCRFLQRDFSMLAPERRAAAAYLAGRVRPCAHRDAIAMIESVHRGIVAFGYERPAPHGAVHAVRGFRTWIRRRIPALLCAANPHRSQPIPSA